MQFISAHEKEELKLDDWVKMKLKKGLKEDEDFVLVSESIWYFYYINF